MFCVSALPPDDLDRIRAAGVDDHGNRLVVTVNGSDGGTPLRCCLREAEVGEPVALLAVQPAGPKGPYAEVGPVFVHRDRCPGYTDTGRYPDGFVHRDVLLRAYGSDGAQVDNRLAAANHAEEAVTALLSRAEVAVIHARNPLAGCFMFSVARAGG